MHGQNTDSRWLRPTEWKTCGRGLRHPMLTPVPSAPDAHPCTNEDERRSAFTFFLDPADCPALSTHGRRGLPMACVLSRDGNR